MKQSGFPILVRFSSLAGIGLEREVCGVHADEAHIRRPLPSLPWLVAEKQGKEMWPKEGLKSPAPVNRDRHGRLCAAGVFRTETQININPNCQPAYIIRHHQSGSPCRLPRL
jgi:hypothetical protein